MAQIEVKNLSKNFRVFDRREGVRGAFIDLFNRKYRTVEAVKEVSFSIEPGERVGYLGPNGAGKSTTLKMLTGILVPSGGTVEVGGLDPHIDREKSLRRIGAIFGQRSQLWWDLAAIESFRLLASIYGLSQDQLRDRMEEFEPVLKLSDFLRIPVRKLSLGQKMRCELAASMLHSPGVVFLDEPTIGLDLVAKENIRSFLLEENKNRGTTLILTTHDLSDIEELCERVIVIDHGKLLYDGSLEALKEQVGGGGSLVFKGLSASQKETEETGDEASNKLQILEEICQDLPLSWAEDQDAFRATFIRGKVKRAELIRRVLNRFEVLDISFEEASIEDVIRKIYDDGIGRSW